MISTNPRLYGSAPYKLALIHGGPGAPGEMKIVAEQLANKGYGIIEPLQTAKTVAEQILELQTLRLPSNISWLFLGSLVGCFICQ